MPTPHVIFRLPESDQERLAEVAKIYGAKDVSEFMRDMVRAITGTDQAHSHRFMTRLGERLTGQLKLEIDLETYQEASLGNAGISQAKLRTRTRRPRDRTS